jgi:glycosyltransferase involved in cell wall biosynthesis
MPKISVIVPVYNAEEYLDRCIGSVLAQTFGDFELILVDDGSTDRSPELCEEYAVKDSRIRVIHQRNSGPSAARNTGIRASKGETLTFVDSDDLISPKMLERLYGLMARTGAGMVLCELMMISAPEEMTSPQKEKVVVYGQEQFMDMVLKIRSNRTMHYVCGKLYSRSVIDSRFFPEDFRLGEDVESTFKAVIRTDRIVCTSGVYYFYYENPNSITRERFNGNYLLLRDAWKRVFAVSKKYAPRYADKVLFNLRRIDFTILTQSIRLGSRNTDEKYSRELALCLKRLRRNMGTLLRGPMVIRRKAVVLAVGVGYRPIRAIYRVIRR